MEPCNREKVMKFTDTQNFVAAKQDKSNQAH